MQEQVLYYSGALDQKTSEAILAALEACQIAYTVLEDSDLDQSIQSLLNTKKQAVIVNRRHQEACMLFREGKEQTFVKLRRAFAQRQIIYSGSKAVVTKHNRTWSFIKLLEEVEEEHRYFQLYEVILKQLKESEALREEGGNIGSFFRPEARQYYPDNREYPDKRQYGKYDMNDRIIDKTSLFS